MTKCALLVVCALGLLASASTAATGPKPVLLGYSAVWRDTACPPEDYNYATLTHIARAFLRPRPDGSVVVPEGYFHPAMEALAREHGVKLLLSLGGGGGSPEDWRAMATGDTSRTHFFDGLARLMAEHGYDGIDVDWEPPDPTKADGEAYGLFVKALRARFPKAVLTTALPADPYQTRFTPWTDVIASFDYVNVMAYDYSGPWSGVAGHATNLFPAGDYAPVAGRSVAEGLDHLTKKAHVPPAKLLMGMNFWGYRFRADRLGDQFKANAPGVSDALTFQQIQALFRTGRYEARWDAKAAMPYLQRRGGGSVICYDDPESVRRKCEYAKSVGCAGVMVWNLGSDHTGTAPELMNAAIKTLGGPPQTLSRTTLEAQILEASHATQRERGVATPLPADLSKLTIDQLVALNADAQARAAVANDAHWQSGR